ncbi:hypothetical protein CK503_07805 [Aliifodinibius salipaludis]|uniref:DUF2911 domain-containing protein n=1 Tax=Fodinibius salipaludis TaxID=2032627 RepID=A0A2A2GB85_9BACT|nr:DUF2911 domain-containing protein [Aliifodinibius salipaludis]PAU94109.1 hypothetical protein CK503_07805 [Aliifodinibius salipaludis]
MKTIPSFLLKTSLVVLMSFSITIGTLAQDRANDEPRTSPNATVSQTIGTTDITITYGRPAVNDRTIFGDLVPYGEVWRTGANESTALVVSDDVTIEGNELEAGTYSLYTVPGKDKWTIIINSKLSWGTQYDKSKDVLRFTVEPQDTDFIERLLFYFEDVTNESATVVLRWDTTKVPFTINI